MQPLKPRKRSSARAALLIPRDTHATDEDFRATLPADSSACVARTEVKKKKENSNTQHPPHGYPGVHGPEEVLNAWSKFFYDSIGTVDRKASLVLCERICELYGKEAMAAVRLFWKSPDLAWVKHIDMSWLANPDNKRFVAPLLRPRVNTQAEYTGPRSTSLTITTKKNGMR